MPAQKAILTAYLWGIGVMVATGAAFYPLGDGLHTGRRASTAIPGFALCLDRRFPSHPGSGRARESVKRCSS